MELHLSCTNTSIYNNNRTGRFFIIKLNSYIKYWFSIVDIDGRVFWQHGFGSCSADSETMHVQLFMSLVLFHKQTFSVEQITEALI